LHSTTAPQADPVYRIEIFVNTLPIISHDIKDEEIDE
jgi:hypothetical protein